jgi:hypothetical protein
MSMTNEERLECLIDHCNKVIDKYTYVINAYGYHEKLNDSFYEIWDKFVDAVETIEEGMK